MTNDNTAKSPAPCLLGLRGVIGAGKTTLANALANMHPGIQVQSFAYPIKMAVNDLGVSKEDHPKAYRHIAQYLGAWCRNNLSQEWWVYAANQRLQTMMGWKRIPACVVYDDVRYPNEREWIHARGGICIYIDRPGHTPSHAEHESEDMNTQSLTDKVVFNDGTPKEAADLLFDLVRVRINNR